MLSAKHQTKYIQVIEWTLYFGLCGLSVFFMYGVLEHFFSGKTSYSQYDEPITELPTIMLCFSKSDIGVTKYEYGYHFKIYYYDDLSFNHEHGNVLFYYYKVLLF